jgi:outer membrane protein OmpA-like peptidoglycan-associated protein
MYTIKIKKVIALITVACAMVMPAAAQQATNTDSTSAASNSGVALTTNSTSGPSTNISAVFPSLVAGSVSVSGCLSSGMELRAGGWNFLGYTTLVQKWSEECAFTPTSKTLLDTCQFLTFRLYQDAYWKKQGVDIRKSWKPKKVDGEIVGPKDYDAYLGTLDNMSFEDCMMLRMPTAAGPSTPTQAPVPPAPQPPVTVNIQWPPMPAPAASAPVVTPPAVIAPVPVVRERHTREAVVALSSLTWFDSGKSKILPAGIAALTKEMAKFSPVNTRVLSVVGRTDDVGAVAYNQKLSEDRANAVAAQLRNMGYAVDEVIGKGEMDPIAQGTSEGARAVNRSVTITVQSTEVSSADGPLPYTRVLGSQ